MSKVAAVIWEIVQILGGTIAAAILLLILLGLIIGVVKSIFGGNGDRK